MATTSNQAYYDRYLRDPVLVRSDFRCTYCGADLLADFDSFFGMVKDHVIPRHRGGPDANTNRVAACHVCDRLKGNSVFPDLESAQAEILGRRFRRLHTFNAVRVAVRQGGDV